MDKETTLGLTTNKTWWVRFNSDSGKINRISVNRSPKPCKPGEEEFETDSDLCDKVLQKQFTLRSCGIFWDDEVNNWNIGKKSTELKLDYSKFKRFLEFNTNSTPVDNDFFITVYKETNEADVEINIASIKRSMNLSDITAVKRDKDTHLNIYFTKRNDPDYLIKKLEVDAERLITERMLNLDLTEVSKHSDWDEISIYTRPIFKRYGMSFVDKRVLSAEDINNKQLIRTCTKDDNAHLIVHKQGNNFVVQNLISSEQQHLVQNMRREFHLLVCDGELDRIAGGFKIRSGEFLTLNKFVIPITFKWPDNPVVYYKSQNIKVKDLGEQYA